MNDQLLRFNFRQKYITFDFETRNLAISNETPWQLGYILAEGKIVKKEIERKIFWPNYEVKPEIAAMNHFDRQTYENEARDPVEVLDEFESYLYDPSYLIVGMNSLGFDCYIHNNWRKTLGRKTDYSWMNRHIDILATFRAIMAGSKTPPKDDLLAWQYNFLHNRDKKVKASLSAQMKHFNLAYDASAHHNAIVDVRYTFEVFWKHLYELDI
jgi:DNA polymerase III epsilon subunit-like protein